MEDLYNRHYKELQNIMLSLKMEFKVNFDHTVLEHNSNLIKKQIYPANSLLAHLSEHNNKEMVLEVKNITRFPVVLDNIQTEKGKILSKSIPEQIIWPGTIKTVQLPLKRAFLNAFVSKKNKRGAFRYPKDIAKVKLAYALLGSSYHRKARIIPYLEENNDFVNMYRKNSEFNFESFPFIELNNDDNIILFKSGNYTLNENIRIPENYKIIVEKGFALDLKNNASIISYAPIVSKGDREQPIKFYSSDSTGGGILISNASEMSILDHCLFSNLSYPQSGNWNLSGAVNFNESEVQITNSVFEKNRCEDGLNIIRSNFRLDHVNFRDTQSDAFDGDFVNGTVTNAFFENCGNDGIDVSGSLLEIQNVEVVNSGDKAISIGEGSTLKGSQIRISGGEIGVVSKDLSEIELKNVQIKDTRLAISCFQKKSEFGPGKISAFDLILLNNELNYLIEENSMLTIDDIAVETKSKGVIELMYGNEYGKSSR